MTTSITAAAATAQATMAANEAKRKIQDAVQNNIVADKWKDTPHDRKAKFLYGIATIFFSIFLGILFVQMFFFVRSADRNRESFVIFTDGDVDDLLALNMLFKRSDVAVPLIVVSGNGLASPAAAYKIVRNFVTTVAGEGSGVASKTRIVLGASMSNRDAVKAFMEQSTSSSSSSSIYEDPSLYCTYSRFSRGSMAVSIAADSLYGQSESLASAARKVSLQNTAKLAKSYNMFTEFGEVVNGALKTGTKLTLLSMSPLTDISTLLDSLNSDTITSAIKLLVVSGGRFGTTTNSGISDAGLFTRDNGRRGTFGSYSELNFYLDPESAENVLSPDSRYTSTLLPTVVIPVDVSGSVSAYTDYPDQWSKLSSAAANANSPSASILARALRSFSNFEGSTFFPYKGTPKSIAAVAVALDRSVRNRLYALKQTIGVMTWSTAQTLHLEPYVGRSGSITKSSTSTELGVGMPDVVVGFTSDSSSSSSSSTTSSTGSGMSRLFLDSYLNFVSLPWPSK